tara:strand:- start:22431 stop:23621 length:1191 start_codon:yes stop_codon:yes gene_type:complete
MRTNNQHPSDWKKETVGKRFDVQLGKMLSAKSKTGEQYPYLANYNVRWGNFELGNLNSMHFTDREREKYELKDGDLLMCEGGEIGRCAVWIGPSRGIYYQKALHRIRPKSSQDLTFYLCFYMQYIASQGKLTRLVGESSIAHLTREKLIGLPILLPPLPEQKAIAAVLSTWDAAIEKTERLIEAKERRFRGLMQELMCERKGWKKVRVGSFLTESRIAGSNGLDAKKLTVKLYGNGVIAKSEKRLGSETTKYFVRKSGQFIYSKLDFLNGAFGIIPNELDGYESTLDLPAFDFSLNVSREWFLYYVIRPEYYTQQIGLAKGQRKARRVSPTEFLGSKMPFPPIEEQRQIADALSLVQREIKVLHQILEQYKAQKRGLMQKLLTGEWRVEVGDSYDG